MDRFAATLGHNRPLALGGNDTGFVPRGQAGTKRVEDTMAIVGTIAEVGQSAPSPQVVIAWDPASSRTWTSLQALLGSAPQNLTVRAPGLEPAPGDLLDDQLLSGLIEADAAVLVGSFDNPLLTGFQAGLIQATLGEPVAVAGLTDDDRSIAALCTGREATRLDLPEALWEEVLAGLERPKRELASPKSDPRAVVLYPKTSSRRDPISRRLRSGRARVHTTTREFRVTALPSDVTWVIRGLSLDFGSHQWTALEPNLFNALYAGWFYGSARKLGTDTAGRLRILREASTPPVREFAHLERVFDGDDGLLSQLDLAPVDVPKPLVLEQLTLIDFKCFERLTLDLRHESTLDGNWTCVAGINGSGKTSVLHAACIVLLGRRVAAELGNERLARMVRRTRRGPRPRAEIRAVVRDGAETFELVLPLDERGVDEKAIYASSFAGPAEKLWERLENELLVAYGATRNVSEHVDTRNASLSARARRQMTLFDPLTQVAGVEALLRGGQPVRPALETLTRILDVVLEANELELRAAIEEDRLVFRQRTTEMDVIELPDGFRSLVAWLGDLCVSWHEVTGRESPAEPDEIHGIALLDEIDLHLHASLQRTIVPALRRALPHVQWVVTTHSPLILSSFDRSELVLLDRDEEGGIRTLDRQILGFTSDEVYEWLMGTPPSSAALDERLAGAPDDEALAVLLLQSKDRDEDEARKQLEKTRELVARYAPEEGHKESA